MVLAGALPEEVTEWRRHEGLAVSGGSFDRSPDAQAQAAELAVERAKRRVERGGHAVVLIDSLEALPAGARRRIFGAGRATEEGGTLTLIAAVGGDPRGAPLGDHARGARPGRQARAATAAPCARTRCPSARR